MPAHEYKLEEIVDVEYVFHEWVEPKPYVDVVGEDAYVEVLGPEWLYDLPGRALGDICAHILEAELAGPDPDKESDRRRDEDEM